MSFLFIALLFIFGFLVGSFLGAYTYRLPRGERIKAGRSFCPHCKKKISWFDNIPLLSFIALRGKCRKCGKKISWRYPLIELSTAVLFIVFALLLKSCRTPLQDSIFKDEAICFWKDILTSVTLPYFLLVISILIAIFVIDLEHQLLPDCLVYILFLVTFFFLIIFSSPTFYLKLLSAFGAALSLLVIHLVTRGRGMGLGDVKLALVGGILLGWPGVLVWLFLSFLIGAVVGVIMIFLGKASFGKQIPFGPFLVVSLIITLIWGKAIFGFLLPVL